MLHKTDNRLLDALPSATLQWLLAACTSVELPLGTALFQRDSRPRYIYFLKAGIGSVVFNSERGTSVELSTQGAEGLIGYPYLLGPDSVPSDCNMQVPGAGYRIPLAAMQAAFDRFGEVRQRVLEYAQLQVIIANQIVACNRLHRAEARFVRWLLMVSDRVGTNELPMTQEFMSTMLGTRRTTVAEVCSDLARAGGLEGRRGGVRLVNRRVLESRVCECYHILAGRYNVLYRAPVRELQQIN